MAEPRKRGSEPVILVVDDNVDNRDILSRWLRRKDLTTISAENGLEALTIIENTKIDLVFLDLMMPGMSGYEVLVEIRKHFQPWQLPVIVATARADKESILQAFEKGANDYITKPIIFAAALSRAENLLTQKRLQEEVMEINSLQEKTIAEKTQQLQNTIAQLEAEVERSQVIQQNLQVAKEKAEIASQSKSNFLANMSHELRTPLNAIIGFSEILKIGMLGNKPITCSKEYASDINDSAIHLLSIINDILDLSKIEASKISLDEDRVSLLDMVNPVLSILSQRIESKNIQLNVDVTVIESIHLSVDERRFKQILLNLMSNAVKFTAPDGKIEMTTICDQKTGFTLHIKDNGIGMAPDDIPRAMAPFAQIDSGLNRQYEGTGLGLPLVKALIEMHDGTFWIDSALDLGTTAKVWLPSSRMTPENEAKKHRSTSR